MIKRYLEYVNENDKWINDSIKERGSLRKSLKKKKNELITRDEIDSELQALRWKDKDKNKPGVQLNKKDSKKYKRLNLAKVLTDLREAVNNTYDNDQIV